jgi:hypothetical protein
MELMRIEGTREAVAGLLAVPGLSAGETRFPRFDRGRTITLPDHEEETTR